jgi:hypothetical protein
VEFGPAYLKQLLIAPKERRIGCQQLYGLADHVMKVDKALFLQPLLISGEDETVYGVPTLVTSIANEHSTNQPPFTI